MNLIRYLIWSNRVKIDWASTLWELLKRIRGRDDKIHLKKSDDNR